MRSRQLSRKGCLAGIWGATLSCLAAATVPIVSAAPASASTETDRNIIIDWYQTSGFLLFNRGLTGATPPWVSAPDKAIVNGAVYDATNGISRTHQAYVAIPPSADPGDSVGAAAATASYRVLLSLLPEMESMLDSKYQSTLALIPNGPAKNGGIAVGEEAASAMLAARQNDGRNAEDETFPTGNEPGKFRPVPPSYQLDAHAWVRNVKPFLIPGVERFQVEAPIPLTSEQYAADVNETKSLGSQSSATRTPEQLDVGLYWQQAPWGDIAAQLARRQGLDGSETARLFAMTALAEADGQIMVGHNKYLYHRWRPVTAIREADTDGNPATAVDPNWLPLEDQSEWEHPEYPAGHNYAAGVYTRAFEDFFGSDTIAGGAISVFSRSSNTTRSFTTFSQMAGEMINARINVGVHFRTSGEVGTRGGQKISDYEFENYFQSCDRTVAGTHQGSLSLTTGVTCLAPGARVTGSINVSGGAGFVADKASIGGSINTGGATRVHIRNVGVGGSLSIGQTTGQVLVSHTNIGSSVLVVNNNTGQRPIVVSGNHIGGSLSCSGNQPAPVNYGVLNTVGGWKSNQCSSL
ncbi:vanadium-dependent haloperoxidase [Frankia sp. Mgl5]|uniref:vanadium-dependent haloperoxidase n=1 Tax=Frankia sp. Mgl5 TaxID=2933793 RepID=UPI00200F8ABF|nr:vanadium-dependent haloperoxidase [Frankia sp. Mgl5]MCK9932150.1 vanadium-dependent haloperoxidase [Frankia sp. Mgl5]